MGADALSGVFPLPKYRLDRTDIRMVSGARAFRLVALRDFGNVRASERGGHIQGEHNLSHDGLCWAADGAMILDLARVWGNVRLTGQACMAGRALACGDARITDSSMICDDAELRGHVHVGGHSRICGRARIGDHVRITGSPRIGGTVRISGRAVITGCPVLDGNQEIGGSDWIGTYGPGLLPMLWE